MRHDFVGIGIGIGIGNGIANGAGGARGPHRGRAGYTPQVRRRSWDPGRSATDQLRELLHDARTLGLLVVRFPGGGGDGSIPSGLLDEWSRCRAVSVADVAGTVRSPALDCALCCDLVFMRADAALELPPAVGPPPSPAVVWALAMAGVRAARIGLLEGGRIGAEPAVACGLAHEVVPSDGELPLPQPVSVAALTAARDLVRARAGGGPAEALELATFRLLFAAGDPEEGARAFLEKRKAVFGRGQR